MRAMGPLISGILLAAAVLSADAQELTQAQIDDIIQKFAAQETAFSRARENYTYRQSARIQTLDPGGNATGRWEQVSDIIFSPEGKRTERVVRAPLDTLREITLTPQDMQDLKDVQPFVLNTNELPKYLIRYLGKETLDEIPCYTFAVKPKKLEPGQRYFQGLVWVDDTDLQIVKSYGRGIGLLRKNEDQQFPKFETYREQIDGKYWFPTYTIANDTLHFREHDVRVRQTVRYEDYKQFKAATTITFGDVVEDGKDGKAPAGRPTTPPAKKP